MLQDRRHEGEVEQAALRMRLVGLALATTFLILSIGADEVAAAATLIAYAGVSGALRYAFRGATWRSLPVLGVATDVAFATAISLSLPGSQQAWVLYAIPIATAALRYGALGAAASTAGAIVAYDLSLVLRRGDTAAIDLWPVQVLLAFGVIAAELVWAIARGEADRRSLRAHALAQRDLSSATTSDDLLDRLVQHAVGTFGAGAAWIEDIDPSGRAWTRHPRGIDAARENGRRASALALELSHQPRTILRAAFEPGAAERSTIALQDLVADAARLLGNVRVRELQARLLDTDDSMLQATVRIARDRAVEAIFAEVVTTATELAGAAAIVRPADGGVVAGDLAPERAVAIARGAIPPALVQAARTVGDPAATAAVVSIGEGLCLVAVGLRRDLDEDDVQRLAALSDAAAAAIAQVTERDRLGQRVDELDAAVAEQGRQLKERDDAVASAVHELRTPLTSVQAYGQIMSKNLQAVQRQVAQLDRLIDDLLHMQPGTSRLRSLTDVDLLREARDAANRLRLVSQADVEVTDDGSGDFAVNGDPGRLAQVLDNLLGNAAKFSPPGEPINVDLRRADAEVVLSVTDAGAGIAAADLPRVFDRYFRGAEQRESVSGAGIGLAVSRDIVAAHGGRIWATSAGPGHGSTFSMALPALVKAEVR